MIKNLARIAFTACLLVLLAGCPQPAGFDSAGAARAAGDKPVPIAPTGVVNQLKPVFSWQPMTGAAKYWLLVGDGPKVASSNISIDVGDITATSYASTVKLQNGKTYYWKVKGITSGTLGAWSDVASFTVNTSAPTPSHEVIVAYYPIEPRWGLIGDKEDQLPLLKIKSTDPYCSQIEWYANVCKEFWNDQGQSKTYPDEYYLKTIEFDFRAMRNAGVTVVNVHNFIDRPIYEDFYRKMDGYAGNGLRWAYTCDGSYPADRQKQLQTVEDTTVQIIQANYPNYFTFQKPGDGVPAPVFFWEVDREIPPGDIAARVNSVRARTGKLVHVILDHMGATCDPSTKQILYKDSPYQNFGMDTAGTKPVNWFTDPDGIAGINKPRISGYYSWVAVHWAMNGCDPQVVQTFVQACLDSNSIPVIAATPSFDQAGRTDVYYNVDHLASVWGNQLQAALSVANAQTNAWLYIQAYDEWGEGTTIAPTQKDRFAFLSMLRQKLVGCNWLSGAAAYAEPPIPDIYSGTPTVETPNAEFVSWSGVPANIGPGRPFTVTITMRNTGNTTWTAASNYKLGFTAPQDASVWGTDRITMASGASVTPGSTYPFTATLTAPATVGSAGFQWRMVREGVTWFGAHTPSVTIQVTASELRPGDVLLPNQYLTSADGRFTLIYQGDGNLVLYLNMTTPLWNSGTAGTSPGRTIMQGDGNLVVYDASWQPVWSSNTFNNPGAWLVLQNDGNLVVYSAANQPLWASQTAGY
jgi:hypothetical protein